MFTRIDPLFGLIQVFPSVKIKGSGGRIYLGKVVQVSSESKSVGVEGDEHDELKRKDILLDLVFKMNNELRPNTIFKQLASLTNQQVRLTTAIPLPASDLSSSRLTLGIDATVHEYSSQPPPILPPELLQKT